MGGFSSVFQLRFRIFHSHFKTHILKRKTRTAFSAFVFQIDRKKISDVSITDFLFTFEVCYSFIRSTYVPFSVSTLIRSPSLMNSGTFTMAPVSTVAGLVALVAVLPLTPGST